jgi:cell division protease FtsH
LGDPTTGAQNDIEQATRIARAMVTEFGMSDRIGPQQLGRKEGEVFLGREYGHEAVYSDDVATVVDGEVRRFIDDAHTEAREILTLHRVTLDRLADALVEHETLDDADLAVIFEGLTTWAGSGGDDESPPPPASPLTVAPVTPGPAAGEAAAPAGATRASAPGDVLRRLRLGWRGARRTPRPEVP